LEGATVDLGRAVRCRFGEVVFGAGKSGPLIVKICRALLAQDEEVLITRVDAESVLEISKNFPFHRWQKDAKTLRVSQRPIVCRYVCEQRRGISDHPECKEVASIGLGIKESSNNRRATRRVVVITAGSTDRHVAMEAVETLDWMGIDVDLIEDVGVAGPQRLIAAIPRVRLASVVVVVAGMEAALASVVGGYVKCPIVAVPTSVGYGTNLGGITALLGMLTSCAANVTVVGIDAGFKAGYVSGLIVAQLLDSDLAAGGRVVSNR
jgi:NCAIR mutase (PurE)-related protein